MRYSYPLARFALAVGLYAAAHAAAYAQQPARDTIVVVQRDTLFVIQRDTVFVQPTPSRPPERADGDDRDYEDVRAARRARLEQLRRARGERLGQLGDVRGAERALAYYLYPTRLLEIDFPALTFGVAYVKEGRIGAMGSLGVLTRPINDFRTIPDARGPVRGIDIGGEFRYYLSPNYRRFPIYFGAGGSYSWAPVRYTRFILNPDDTFERLGSADATGRRIRVSALVGWEFRSDSGLAIDLTTGLEYHGRGVFTDNDALARSLEDDFFNSIFPNEFNPAIYPIMRVGIGFGKW